MPEQERERRWRQAEEVDLLESFGGRRKTFEELQKLRRAEEQKDRAVEREARIGAGRSLLALEGLDYEVGPAKALEDRTEKPWLKRFGTYHNEEAELIRERYPTLSKWMGLGHRGEAAEKIPGGKKLHKTYEMLPDRLKNAVKLVKKQVKAEQEGYMPFGFDKRKAEYGLKSLVMGAKPGISKGVKEFHMKEGWESLIGALTGSVKRIPHEMGQLKHAAKLGYRGYDSDIYAKELDIFGIEDRVRGLADEAKYDVQKKQESDRRSL